MLASHTHTLAQNLQLWSSVPSVILLSRLREVVAELKGPHAVPLVV